MEKQHGEKIGIGSDRDDFEQEQDYQVKDRRHWAEDQDSAEDGNDGNGAAESAPARPSIVEEYRGRAEAAEAKLQEYIDAHKQFRAEQEQVRQRLNRDVDRRVEQKFSSMVESLLETLDNLDMALAHSADVAEAAPLAEGVLLARNRFLTALEQVGIDKIVPDGQPFDPNEAEALRMDPVDAGRDGTVTETLQPGYRLGEHLIRPARVAVGRKSN